MAEEDVTCFERRFCCCIANVGFMDVAELDDMKGRGQRHSEGVKAKGRYLMEEWTVLSLWCFE
jgi:hypothetical protein